MARYAGVRDNEVEDTACTFRRLIESALRVWWWRTKNESLCFVTWHQISGTRSYVVFARARASTHTPYAYAKCICTFRILYLYGYWVCTSTTFCAGTDDGTCTTLYDLKTVITTEQWNHEKCEWCSYFGRCLMPFVGKTKTKRKHMKRMKSCPFISMYSGRYARVAELICWFWMQVRPQ